MVVAAEHVISYPWLLLTFYYPFITPLHMLGTWLEIRYTLMTFGLPVDAFPITHNEDDFSLDNHIDWLSRRKMLEAGLDNTSDKGEERRIITEPGPLDVVMGRGCVAQIHPGNLHYRTLIAERREVYEESLIHQKTALATEIVRLIKESGGRFLQQDGHGWMLVDGKKARTKVSSAFRDSRRKSRSAHPISNSNAATNSTSTKATSPIEKRGLAKLQHSHDDEGMIDPSDIKRLKTDTFPWI
jgi:hypothetical protein